MKRDRTVLAWAVVVVATAGACDAVTEAQGQRTGVNRKPDVIFVPTPMPVVKTMLEMARVGPGDVVYDLGCGDARIPIAAVRDFGAKSAVCIEIEPSRVDLAKDNVRRAGLEDKVEVRRADMFLVDTSPATVVTLYLLEELNVRLRPKLQRELRDGARIVSQTFSMGDWTPKMQANVENRPVYLWIVDKSAAAPPAPAPR